MATIPREAAAWTEFLTTATAEHWTVIRQPDNGSYYGRTEVKRRENGRMVYLTIETDTQGRVIYAGYCFGRDRMGGRHALTNRRRHAQEWLRGIGRS